MIIDNVIDPRRELVRILRTDLRAHMLYLLPRHKDFVLERRWLEAMTKLSSDEVAQLTSRFFQVGLWTLGNGGVVQVPHAHLGLSDDGDENLKVDEYMTMVSQMLTELTETGHCWYEFSMLATTDELKKRFLNKVFEAMQELIAESRKTPSTTVLAWTNISLDVTKVIPGGGRNDD